ncbi:MAG: 1,4-dihydroxy-2-naphthoate polyprenyltransferase [Acidimicrobiales bacterium]
MTPVPARAWVAGARPRTLPAAVVPVLVGTAVAGSEGSAIWWRAMAALVVSLAIQVATNYANDYSDGVRGTDVDRVGPMRLVASGTAPARSVKMAALIAFGVAAVAGAALAVVAGPVVVAVGATCLAAGWFYTGGRRPYGYSGWGEPFVFVFFGLVAVAGTVYVQTGQITALAVLAAVPVGLLATAILVVNNLRDINTDGPAGKHTLAVRLGPSATRALYGGCVVVSFVTVVAMAVIFGRPWILLGLGAAALAWGPVRSVARGEEGPALVGVLGNTGRLQMAFGVLLALGLSL